ncbi:MAG: hypothetical protein EOL97_08965 [Spirochaetia bacterium]|nr:hypothetical protein [Spirochaetia bacterium]
MSSLYYVYRHIRLDTNEVFYVGMGKKKPDSEIKGYNTEYSRAFERAKRTAFWKNIATKTEIRVEILIESDNLNFIKNKEVEFIKLYGKKYNNTGTLVNFQDGGDYKATCRNYNITVIQKDLNGNIIKIWSQLKDIQTSLGFLKTNIVKCCRKKQLTAYGYIWEYADNHQFDNYFSLSSRLKSYTTTKVGVVVLNIKTGQQFLFRNCPQAAKFLNITIAVFNRILRKPKGNGEYIIHYRNWLLNNTEEAIKLGFDMNNLYKETKI